MAIPNPLYGGKPSPLTSEKAPAAEDRRLKAFIFSIFMLQAVVVSYFPLYYDYRGITKTQIGVLNAIGPFVGIFSNLVWGLLCDKYRTIKKVLFFILLAQLVFAVALFQMHTFSAMFIVLILFFFFQSPIYSVTDSLTLLSINKRQVSYASFRVWGSLGFSTAVFWFGKLLNGFGPSLTSVLCISSILIATGFCTLVQDRHGSIEKPNLSAIMKTVSSRTFIWFVLLALIISVASRMNDGFIGLYLRGMGASDEVVGLAWLVGALSEIPVFLLLGKYGSRFNELTLLSFAGLVYALRFFLMSHAADPYTVVFIQLMHSFSFGVYFVTAIRYVGRLVPDEYRATSIAVFGIIWSGASGVFGGIIGGWTFDRWGPHGLYLVGMCIALTASLCFLGTYAVQRRQR